jgi:hypothetical protein
VPWTTTHLGYGQFHLADLLPGEEFARYDGSPGKVCNRQPYRTLNPTPQHLLLPDHIQVWIDYGTSNARKVFLHRTALVRALCPEQARAIEARSLTPKGEPMDANATWASLLRSFAVDDEAACRQCCLDLLAWLDKGGVAPPIVNIPGIDWVMAHAVCAAYLDGLWKGDLRHESEPS